VPFLRMLELGPFFLFSSPYPSSPFFPSSQASVGLELSPLSSTVNCKDHFPPHASTLLFPISKKWSNPPPPPEELVVSLFFPSLFFPNCVTPYFLNSSSSSPHQLRLIRGFHQEWRIPFPFLFFRNFRPTLFAQG